MAQEEGGRGAQEGSGDGGHMRPMTSDSVGIYYFSGTGNTLLVVKKMKEAFERNGLRVGLLMSILYEVHIFLPDGGDISA